MAVIHGAQDKETEGNVENYIRGMKPEHSKATVISAQLEKQ